MIKRVNLRSKTEYPGKSTIKFGVNLNKLLWQPKSLTVLAYGISAQDHSLPNSANLCLIHCWYWEVWRQWASSPQTGHRWTFMLRLINAVGTVQRDYVPVLQHSVCYCGESVHRPLDIYCDQDCTCHFVLLPNDKTILYCHTYRYLKIRRFSCVWGLVLRADFCILHRALWAEDAAGSHVMSMYISWS